MSPPKSSSATFVSGKSKLSQFVLKTHVDLALAQMPDRRLDQHRPEPVPRDQRTACLAAFHQRLPHHRGGQRRRAFPRFDVQRRQQQRMHQPLVKRA